MSGAPDSGEARGLGRLLARRAAGTVGLLLAVALLLGLIFDSGLLGDPALREAGDRASARTVGEARVRLGVLQSFDPEALSVRLDGPATDLLLRTREGRLLIDDGRPVSGNAPGYLAAFRLDGTLSDFAARLDGTQMGDFSLRARALGDGERPAQGLAAALDGMRLRLSPGEDAELGWGAPTSAWARTWGRVSALVTLDFGADRDGRSVAQQLQDRGKRSVALALPAFLLTTCAALGLAMLAALWRGRVDRALTLTAALAMAVPALAWILFLRDWLAFDLALFPVRAWGPPVLPLLVLPILIWLLIAVWPDLRLYRALTVEHADAPWARTLRAAGVPRRRLWWRHLLPAVAAPVLARVALTLPYLFTGSLLLEHVFDIPGLGSAVVDAVRARDEAVLRACAFLFAVGFLLAQWLADALAALVDPRLREEAR